MKYFQEYKKDGPRWITLLDREYYPDYLAEAVNLYSPAERRFRDLVQASITSDDLLRVIMNEPLKTRSKILSIFSRYVSPNLKTELLKKKSAVERNIKEFGHTFRSIDEVKEILRKRRYPDETLSALLYQYKDRGESGYELTYRFFEWFKETFEDRYEITGPEREGKDVHLDKILEDFPYSYPADFVIYDIATRLPIIIGFARYDTDRGGSQEDDRTGGNRDKIPTILKYAEEKGLNIKILFINDGPGLILGSMWDDYSQLEELGKGKVKVVTLKMLDSRLTDEWIKS